MAFADSLAVEAFDRAHPNQLRPGEPVWDSRNSEEPEDPRCRDYRMLADAVFDALRRGVAAQSLLEAINNAPSRTQVRPDRAAG